MELRMVAARAVHIAELLRRGQFRYLWGKVQTAAGVAQAAPTVKDKAAVYEYLGKVLERHDRSLPQANLSTAVKDLERGASKLSSLPVLIEYSNTFTGCNIYPPCAKCFSVPEPKVEYTFAGNDFNGLETALAHVDVLYLGSIAELTFDKNYPNIVKATSADGTPRLVHPTNGILIARHVEQIVGKVRALVLSVDAHTPELYGKLQGKPGHLPAIEAGLRRLAALKREHGTPLPRVSLSITVSRANVDVVDAIYERFSDAEFGVDSVMLSRLGPVAEDNAGRYRGDFVFDFAEQLIDGDEYASLVKKMKASTAGRTPRVFELMDFITYFHILGNEALQKVRGPVCPLPWLYSQCSSSGAVSLCCFTDVEVGNWRRQGLEAVWNGPMLRQIRSEIAEFGVARACIDGTCPVVDRLDTAAREHGRGGLLDDLRRDWAGHADAVPGFLREAIDGTLREGAEFFPRASAAR